jgi:predicted nucleic acid-binding protein
MKFLVDTNIVSEPTKLRPAARVVEWLDRQDPAGLFLPSPVLAEIWDGFYNLPPAHPRRPKLEQFARELPMHYRLIDFDARAARSWGELVNGDGHDLGAMDLLIAAIAHARGFTVTTNDAAPFHRAGLKVFNPFHE